MPKTQTRSATSRVWWLVRGIDTFRSFVFPIQVTIEEDEPNLYGASIPGLEDQIAAMGRTGDEAERNALELFQGIVDDALDKGTSVAFAINSMQYMTANFPITKADEFFKAIENLDLRELDSASEDDDGWRGVPFGPAFLSSPGVELS